MLKKGLGGFKGSNQNLLKSETHGTLVLTSWPGFDKITQRAFACLKRVVIVC